MNFPQAPMQRRESGDDRRAAIAAAARALIVEKGIEGLRTRDIAERVGINIATLHYHVPSKAALLKLVAETLRADFRAQAIARPRSHLSPREQLDHEFYDFAESFFDGAEIGRLMREFVHMRHRDPEIRAVIDPMMRHWTGMLRDILAAGRDDGSFRADLDPEAAALMLVGALWAAGLDDAPNHTRFRQLTDELVRAVANPTHIEGRD